MQSRASNSSSSSRRRHHSNDEFSVQVPFFDADGEGEITLAELDEFIVPGSDDKGRKITLTFNIAPMLDRQLDIIMGSRRFPYANKKDLIRHAVARHLAWLLDIRKSVPRHHLSGFEAMMELIKDDEMSMKMEQVFLLLLERTSDHVAKGEQQESLRLVSMINQKLRELKPSLWVKRFSERFYPRYGGWLRSSTTATAGTEQGKG